VRVPFDDIGTVEAGTLDGVTAALPGKINK